MTAVALAQGEYATCLTCNGAGELGTGEREHETGRAVTVDCHTCAGDGTVDAVQVSTCTVCQTGFWTGDGCNHGVDTLCSECVLGCDDCVTEVLTEQAEAQRRDQLVLAGGGWS